MDRTKDNTEKEIVPKPILGEQSGAQDDKRAETLEEAKALFQKARKRLLDINNWHEYAGTGSAEFTLTDKSGNEINRLPEVGDFIKINIPVPGSSEGDGYDWVEIEAIEDKRENIDEFVAIRVRPSQNPRTPADEIAHFHADTSTSTFIVQREGTLVSAAEKGRNQLQNREEELGFFDKLRNIIISFFASKGAAYPQWKALMKGFLK